MGAMILEGWSCLEPRSFCFLYGEKCVAKIPAEYDAQAGGAPAVLRCDSDPSV